jgi:8-oxo-dGTP pyrophosphatase MutT (NUDIX family)
VASFEIRRVEQRYDAGFFSVDELEVAAPDGSLFTREVVRHCGAVVVVPMPDPETVLCVRQYRVALDQPLLEVVAGRRDVAGEDPEVAARRELAEEIGMRAGRLIKLCEMDSGPGFTDEHLIVYLALDLEPNGGTEPDGHEEAEMTVEAVPLAATHDLIASGALTDAKSIIGMLLARDYLAGSFPGMR